MVFTYHFCLTELWNIYPTTFRTLSLKYSSTCSQKFRSLKMPVLQVDEQQRHKLQIAIKFNFSIITTLSQQQLFYLFKSLGQNSTPLWSKWNFMHNRREHKRVFKEEKLAWDTPLIESHTPLQKKCGMQGKHYWNL